MYFFEISTVPIPINPCTPCLVRFFSSDSQTPEWTSLQASREHVPYRLVNYTCYWDRPESLMRSANLVEPCGCDRSQCRLSTTDNRCCRLGWRWMSHVPYRLVDYMCRLATTDSRCCRLGWRWMSHVPYRLVDYVCRLATTDNRCCSLGWRWRWMSRWRVHWQDRCWWKASSSRTVLRVSSSNIKQDDS